MLRRGDAPSDGAAAVVQARVRARRNTNELKKRVLAKQRETFSEVERTLMRKFESLDYDTPNCPLQRDHDRDNPIRTCSGPSPVAIKWLLHGSVGAGIGTIAFCVSSAVEVFTEAKFNAVQGMIERGETGLAYLAYVSMSTAFVAVAALLTGYIEPLSAGSGITEVKGYLNGVGYERLLRVRTLVVKFVGVIFSVRSLSSLPPRADTWHAPSVTRGMWAAPSPPYRPVPTRGILLP